jgi:hypothetical protein
VRAWGLDVDPADFVRARTYGDVVSAIFQAWAAQAQKRRWGDKTPRYVLDIPVLVEIFPTCKIIHIYRDGRDVALSWLRLGDEPRNVFAAALAWKRYVERGREAGARLASERYMEVKFEKLLDDPRSTLEEVCSFIDEQFSTDLLKVTLGPKKASAERESRVGGQRLPNPASRILNANMAKWKSEMSEADEVLFESVAGHLLETLGYEVIGERRVISRSERIFWRSHQAIGWFVHRLNRRGIIGTAARRAELSVAGARRLVSRGSPV